MRSRTALFGVTDLLLLGTVCIWAVNFIVIKNVISGSLEPIAFTALRFAVASIVLLPLLRSLTPAERAVNDSDRWKIVGLGLIGNSLYQIFFITALANTLPTNAALILATPPIFIALIGALFKLERLTWLAWLGIFLSFGGITLVILGGAPAESSSSAANPLLGDLMALGAAIMWALYTLLAAPVLKRHPPIKLTALTVAVGAVPLLADRHAVISHHRLVERRPQCLAGSAVLRRLGHRAGLRHVESRRAARGRGAHGGLFEFDAGAGGAHRVAGQG